MAHKLTASEQLLVDQALAAPIAAAHVAAMCVFQRLGAAGEDDERRLWFDPLNRAETTMALVTIIAPFVRANRDAPAEAAYRHAAMSGAHSASANAWGRMPLNVRAAYEAFRATLLAVDDALAGERAKIPAPARPARRVAVEDTIFETVGRRDDLVSFARARRAPPPAPAKPKGRGKGGKGGRAKK